MSSIYVELKRHIGTKIVDAAPMSKHEFYPAHRSDELDEPGYLVEYEDGYRSWSPAEAFEKAYRAYGQMTFGLAIEALKKGLRVARTGWNGKGMFLAYFSPVKENPAYADGMSIVEITHPLLPFIAMKTADDMWVPWLASQTDVLAEDWTVVL